MDEFRLGWPIRIEIHNSLLPIKIHCDASSSSSSSSLCLAFFSLYFPVQPKLFLLVNELLVPLSSRGGCDLLLDAVEWRLVTVMRFFMKILSCWHSPSWAAGGLGCYQDIAQLSCKTFLSGLGSMTAELIALINIQSPFSWWRTRLNKKRQSNQTLDWIVIELCIDEVSIRFQRLISVQCYLISCLVELLPINSAALTRPNLCLQSCVCFACWISTVLSFFLSFS